MYVVPIINVTGFRKTDPNGTFGILRITNLKYLTHYEFLLLDCSHAKFIVQLQQLFRQCFITIDAVQLTLLGFEQLFHSNCNITDGTLQGVGRQVAEGGYTFHQDTDSSGVSSVSDRNRLNSWDKSRQSLAAFWCHSHPY